MKNKQTYITMTGEELGVRLRELQGKLLTLRTQAVTEKVEDPTAIGKTRREIARVLTARRAQHLGIKHAPAAPSAKAEKAAKPERKPKAAAPKAKAPRGEGESAGGKKKVSKKTAKKSASK
jgi:ribosomal protein L29